VQVLTNASAISPLFAWGPCADGIPCERAALPDNLLSDGNASLVLDWSTAEQDSSGGVIFLSFDEYDYVGDIESFDLFLVRLDGTVVTGYRMLGGQGCGFEAGAWGAGEGRFALTLLSYDKGSMVSTDAIVQGTFADPSSATMGPPSASKWALGPLGARTLVGHLSGNSLSTVDTSGMNEVDLTPTPFVGLEQVGRAGDHVVATPYSIAMAHGLLVSDGLTPLTPLFTDADNTATLDLPMWTNETLFWTRALGADGSGMATSASVWWSPLTNGALTSPAQFVDLPGATTEILSGFAGSDYVEIPDWTGDLSQTTFHFFHIPDAKEQLLTLPGTYATYPLLSGIADGYFVFSAGKAGEALGSNIRRAKMSALPAAP
jgi:hypothetical protein